MRLQLILKSAQQQHQISQHLYNLMRLFFGKVAHLTIFYFFYLLYVDVIDVIVGMRGLLFLGGSYTVIILRFFWGFDDGC